MPSDEVLKSELDLFKRLSFQKSIDNSVFIEYRPTSSLTESSTIEFNVPITSEEIMLMLVTTLNPFAFNHYNLNYLVVHLNNESYPRTPYMPKYDDAENLYFRAYHDFFLNIGATKGAEQPAISYQAFKLQHCLYAFNFTSAFESPDISERISIPKTGVMNIELRFKSNLTEALKVICFLEFDSLIEIDYQRNVLINY